YLPHLGRPTVALDAADAMLRLARVVAPDAWPVRADLEALPFRRGALGAGWARASYVHVRTEQLPAALADLHHALAVGAPATLSFIAGESGPWPGDDFPGRWFAGWSADTLHDVLLGAGFEVQALDAAEAWLTTRLVRARSLPDTVG